MYLLASFITVSFASVGSLSCGVLLIFSDNMDYWVWGKEQVYFLWTVSCAQHKQVGFERNHLMRKKEILEKVWFGRF